MKRGVVITIILIVLIAAAAIYYFKSQPELSEAAIRECYNAPDKSACLSDDRQILKCQQKASPDEQGMAELKKCIEGIKGPIEAPINCAEQPDIPECVAVKDCMNSENPSECLSNAGAGKVPVVIETSS